MPLLILSIISVISVSLWELEFGRIDPGESRNLKLSFNTDKMMRTQDIPVTVNFDEYNGYTPSDINAKLHTTEMPRPKFDYAYRLIDSGTPDSVGNGDGIIQEDESVDMF
ncbi:hypothetical protein GF312_02375 [Candidatus Poribacteria bacterium]|nr:hypothetical protein [Candidatus Poribacteria bacterium]